MAVCRRCGSPGPAEAQFCPTCGTAVPRDGVREIRKAITALFCDVKGATGLGERLQPEAFRGVFTRYFDAAARVLKAHGGTVYPQIGDGILGVFGIPRLHEDDALRAVRAAVELLEALPTLNDELRRDWGVQIQARIGVNTGDIAVEEDGGDFPTLLGDVLNVAFRLQEEAAPGEIILDASTRWLVRNAVEVEALGTLPVRGRSAPIAAYRLVDIPTQKEGLRALDAEFIGRGQELTWLRLAYQRTRRERTCHLVTVLGPVGVGKSRLAGEFSATVATEATVLRGRCLPYGDGITFWPIAVAVRQAAGMSGNDPPDIVQERLASMLGDQHDRELITAQVMRLLALAEPGGGARPSGFWALRRLLEVLSGRRPIVLIIEDLHWAEPALLDLLEHVAERSREAPIMIVCLAREVLLEDRPTWGGGKLNATSMLLSPLSKTESAQLIAQLLGSTTLPAAARATIARMAEGNPLFIEELVATARDDDRTFAAVARAAGGDDRDGGPVPPAVQAVLGTRLERLEPEERTVLERAAVIGVHFSFAMLLGLSDDLGAERVGTILETLIRKELVRPHASDLMPGEGFRFRHGLIRDTAYNAIPIGTRAVLHERVADRAERILGDRAREVDTLIGYNLGEAYRYRTQLGPADEHSAELARRAGGLLSRAGKSAFGRDDLLGTISLMKRALEFLPEVHARRPEALVILAEALRATGQLADAGTALDTAIDAATAAGDTRMAMHAEIGRLDQRWYTDLETLLDEGPATAEQAVRMFERHGDDRGLANAWRLRARIEYRLGRSGAAHTAIEYAIDAARRVADQLLEARALSNACWIVLLGPMPVAEVVAYLEPILRWAERTGNRRLEAHALRALARAHAMLDDFDTARELLGAATTITTRLGDILHGSTDANSAGFIELLAGDSVAAERVLRRSFETLIGFGAKHQAAAVAGLLARSLLAQDRLEEADFYARVTRENAAVKDVDAQVKWRRAQARILAGRSQFARATRLSREEVVLADQTDWLDMQAETRMDLAHVLGMAGRSRPARSVLEQAVAYYRRKGNLAGVRQAVRALNGIQGRLAVS